MDWERLRDLSLLERKSVLMRTVKLQEEVGELAQEVLIAEKASGSAHKVTGQDGILGECVDVMIVAISIFFASGGNLSQLTSLMEQKCDKWEKLRKI